MDALDYSIYRYLSSDGAIRFWGARRVIDPHVPMREIATRVGLSEAGVRARLRSLMERGFLRGSEVGLNPALFDASLVVSELPIAEPREVRRLFDEIALVEGVTFARDILDEESRKLFVYYVSDNPGATARRTALLRRLSPNARLRGPTPYWLPPCTLDPSRLDWRLLREFREHPDATLSESSKRVGVSPKTEAGRLRRLIGSKACWWTIGSSSEEMPLALLSVTLRPDAPAEVVLPAIQAETPEWMPVAPDGYGQPPSRPEGPVAGLVPSEAPAKLERVVRTILSLDGVENVHRTFALGSRTYPAWFDERLEKASPPREGRRVR